MSQNDLMKVIFCLNKFCVLSWLFLSFLLNSPRLISKYCILFFFSFQTLTDNCLVTITITFRFSYKYCELISKDLSIRLIFFYMFDQFLLFAFLLILCVRAERSRLSTGHSIFKLLCVCVCALELQQLLYIICLNLNPQHVSVHFHDQKQVKYINLYT